ncbi:DUF5695 domain-containing protein [Acidipila sp. EB88]|uniref:DUF5695 domain-containing protein n=1 Tax=Acidipila sp. EB88 TaxID=2305226 RepID=UPI000F600A47|nr:DUF5695 domain-containing protein [Acidipila sp. EB88]
MYKSALPIPVRLAILCALAVPFAVQAQKPEPLPPGPMFSGGHMTLHSGALGLDVLRYSGTVASLTTTGAVPWNYAPTDKLSERSQDTFYHLGDIDLRVRAAGATAWQALSSATHREPQKILTATDHELTGDITNSLPPDSPVRIVRSWKDDGDALLLSFALTNTTNSPLEIGGVGMAMVFNNIMNDRTLEQAYSECSFYDPYIGEDAGYVQVAPLKGTGPVLLVLADQHTPFEAWKPILDRRSRTTHLGEPGNDPTPRGTTFEGSFDWMVHSAAFAETEWKGAQEWNPPTAETLAPGASAHYTLRFVVAPDIRQVESTLAAHHRPVAVGIPGYVVPQDQSARLFLRSTQPVRAMRSEPAGALSWHDDGTLPGGLLAYTLQGKQWGRARLVIEYADGTTQSIAYRVIKPEREAIADMGHFLFNDQWFDQPNDPFYRAPSVISYDDSVHAQVTQESRVWIAGLSDEGGAGAWLAAAMKEFLEPDAAEVAKLERFVDETVWGHLQVAEGEHRYGVHKSLFFYQPSLVPAFQYDPKTNWTSWTSWNKESSDDLGRSYNYPHVVAAYWALYTIARNTHGLATHHPWQWYLDQAYETTMAMRTQAPYYTQFGQMEGTVFVRLLDDLKREGKTEEAGKLESWMRERAEHWRSEAYPFGSEMPWDSTGQEEVYDWTRYFGFADKADVTLNAILGYTPVLPSWGYNGSSRRYWDFLYGGKYPRIERQLHHYGSGLNAIPLLAEYRSHPDDLYLLRAGYAGMTGALTTIDTKGFASAAFHSFPDRMADDPYTGDYGPNFFGHAVNTGTYIVNDKAMGWLAFGGNLSQTHDVIDVSVLDSSRRSIFLAPLGLWITLDGGTVDRVRLNTRTQRVTLMLSPATQTVSTARLRLSVPADTSAHPRLSGNFALDAGAWTVPLSSKETSVEVER